MENQTIKIFSTPNCPYCQMLKDFLQKNAKNFTEIDITKDPNAGQELLKISGQMGVPVTVVSGIKSKNQVIIGFDQDALGEALEIKI